MRSNISEFPDPLCDLRDAVENHLNWLKRLDCVLKTADLTIREKFLEGLTESIEKQTAITESTCRNIEEFEKKLS